MVKLKTVNISELSTPAQVIFESLRTAIIDGSLHEGEVLRQDHIAQLFNVSRIPVREALMRLEEQGLVTTQRYRGSVVAALSFEEIQEIFEFRSLLESEVIRYSVQNITDETLHLAENYAIEFSTTKDENRWGELNRLFSLYII